MLLVSDGPARHSIQCSKCGTTVLLPGADPPDAARGPADWVRARFGDASGSHARTQEDGGGSELGLSDRGQITARMRKLGAWGDRYGLQFGVIRRVGDLEVVLGRKFTTVYVPQNAKTLVEGNMPRFGPVFPVGYRGRTGGDFADPTAGFIPVNGKPEKIEYVSSDPAVVELYNDGSARFPSGGKATVSVRIAGESLSVPVTVVEFPLNAGLVPRDFGGKAASAVDVIRCLGLPDRKTPHYVAQSNSRKIDGIYYATASGGIAVEHWEYKKYPGAVLAIAGHPSSGWMRCVGTKPN
jgi:hypothetical protein